ncbi:hypothetical protein LXM63_11800 [Chryseobacterium gleum]|uniref:P-loop ATPase, Sll1717 family n=1 Tax=Chryseobacterium gleum TaxID=250 RepID=UPI001E2B372A|nr:hypothetical protein [Chryseobacterium gleum]MCE4065780.1 hypothetical protein [Chryseobacterium gleum]
MEIFTSLNLGFADAENYKKRENKKLLNKYFIKTDELNELVDSNKYFLIGDKGTGKTAYSIFLSNNEYKNTNSKINYIRETEYSKFIALKKEKQLTLTDYTNIWKVLIYLLISAKIQETEKENIVFSIHSKFRPLKEAIDEFYKSAFSPEIINAISIVEESQIAASILSKNFNLSGHDKVQETFNESRFQVNLMFIQKKFETALNSLNLEKNHIQFIDGIDIRPRNIDYEDYLECIKGLANATWSLNNDFFANIKGSKGRIKVVLLLRPDIFSHLGLQNLNTKIRDNSVLLDWRTTYPIFNTSKIFKMSDNILSSQQKTIHDLGECWNHYFNFSPTVVGKKENSFVSFLRYSMFRPRDIVTMMTILQDKVKNEISSGRKYPIVDQKDFESSEFLNKYSDYLLGEIKDYLAFYHSDKDYELFLKFFEFLNGKAKFTYEDYINSYDEYANYIEKDNLDVPYFFDSSDSFLQFLYDLNIICYVEDTEEDTHIHWSFRERTYSNINPKVKEGLKYIIHYGLQKSFNTGKKIKRRVIKKKVN